MLSHSSCLAAFLPSSMLRDEAQAEPSTRASQLRGHRHIRGRCTVRPSPTHTLAHTPIRPEELTRITHPGPTTRQASPQIVPFPCISCLRSTLNLALEVGPGVQGHKHECFLGHGCLGPARWYEQPGLLLRALSAANMSDCVESATAKYFLLEEGVLFPFCTWVSII